jgi:hypothetical protein
LILNFEKVAGERMGLAEPVESAKKDSEISVF